MPHAEPEPAETLTVPDPRRLNAGWPASMTATTEPGQSPEELGLPSITSETAVEVDRRGTGQRQARVTG